jgi:hypothetical protein
MASMYNILKRNFFIFLKKIMSYDKLCITFFSLSLSLSLIFKIKEGLNQIINSYIYIYTYVLPNTFTTIKFFTIL